MKARVPWMPPSVSEAVFQARVIALAQMFGWRVMHQRPSQNRRGVWETAVQGNPGYPDLTLAKPGRLPWFIELKTAKGKPSQEQLDWLEALGPNAELLRPADWPYIVTKLSGGDAIVVGGPDA